MSSVGNLAHCNRAETCEQYWYCLTGPGHVRVFADSFLGLEQGPTKLALSLLLVKACVLKRYEQIVLKLWAQRNNCAQCGSQRSDSELEVGPLNIITRAGREAQAIRTWSCTQYVFCTMRVDSAQLKLVPYVDVEHVLGR
jgi:hypothetical protein